MVQIISLQLSPYPQNPTPTTTIVNTPANDDRYQGSVQVCLTVAQVSTIKSRWTDSVRTLLVEDDSAICARLHSWRTSLSFGMIETYPNQRIRSCRKNPALLNLSFPKESYSNCTHYPHSSKNDRYQRSVRAYVTMAQVSTIKSRWTDSVRTLWMDDDSAICARLHSWRTSLNFVKIETHPQPRIRQLTHQLFYKHAILHAPHITLTLASRPTRPPALATIQQPTQSPMKSSQD